MSPLTPQSRLFILRTILQHPSLRPTPRWNTRSLSSTPLPSSGSSSPLTLSEPSSSIPSTSTPRISRSTLHRLHRLSALNPPSSNSTEETQLIEELSDLIALMDEVKGVELPSSVEERAELLNQGVFQEVVVSQDSLDELDRARGQAQAQSEKNEEQEKGGRKLLGWSTNRLGDYYASRIKRKEE
ncbi:hypothetical protein I302_107035 [Kwoniella bestiolae CBS 10118]|uniref:Glutamyl-tRNA amidotransferase complex subunit Gta3 domain-containing protein n=1 Tax=Kwoniella bestiolae CBS 10118 TaxID=1296100 RepID=A0A1B9FZQ2_9TREE|nr:hypothetical protein I302_05700 [Kwoniella bestiolae CBS 10118]OCF24241.1 hypothetical protein I302_05700 [Kwoniella bestiolae CBS 10118]